MSYILDALRRADAERERGAVPGLHAQNRSTDQEPAARDHRPLLWAAAGAGALLVAVVVVLLFGPWRGAAAPDARVAALSAPAQTANPGDGAQPAPAAGELAPSRSGALAPAALPVEPPLGRRRTDESRTPAAPARVATRVDGQAPVTVTPAAATRLAERAASGRVGVVENRGAGAATKPSPYDAATAAAAAAAAQPVEHYGPAVTPAAAPAPAARPAAPPPNPVVALNDLPAATRAGLPKLTVGGAIYSDSAPARILILNGQPWHEGDKPAADTVLEQIRHKSAVLNFRGQRYEIAF